MHSLQSKPPSPRLQGIIWLLPQDQESTGLCYDDKRSIIQWKLYSGNNFRPWLFKRWIALSSVWTTGARTEARVPWIQVGLKNQPRVFLFCHGICCSHYFKQLHNVQKNHDYYCNIVCLIPTSAVHWFKWDDTIVVIILISVHLSTLFVVSYIPCTF